MFPKGPFLYNVITIFTDFEGPTTYFGPCHQSHHLLYHLPTCCHELSSKNFRTSWKVSGIFMCSNGNNVAISKHRSRKSKFHRYILHTFQKTIKIKIFQTRQMYFPGLFDMLLKIFSSVSSFVIKTELKWFT